MSNIFMFLTSTVGHSLTAALLFVAITLIAWALDSLVHYMRARNLDALLCKIFHLTAACLAGLDCLLILHYAGSFFLTTLSA